MLRLTWHYDLLSQTVRLKKAVSRRTLFCFSAASGTLREDIHTFYCCWRQQLSWNIVVLRSIFLCIWRWHVALTVHTDGIAVFPLQLWLRERAELLRYTYVACLVKYLISIPYVPLDWNLATSDGRLTKWKRMCLGFHRAFFKSVTFIGRPMHSIV